MAFRLSAHGLHRRRPAGTPLGDLVPVALPDYPPGAALRSLGVRRTEVQADSLVVALDGGALVRAPSLRGTTHVFATADTPVFTTAVLPAPGDEVAARGALGSAWAQIDGSGFSAIESVALVTEAVAGVVADGRSRTKGALSEALHEHVPDALEPWCERCQANHVPEQLFRLALIRAGVWFAGDGSTYVASPVVPNVSDRPSALVELARRFLSAYAPATSRAFAEWSGLDASEAKAAVSALGDEIIEVRLDGKPALAHAADAEQLQSPTPPTGVRLVPAGDPFLHQRDRATLVADPARRRSLWRPAGAPGLVLAGGVPAGTWRHKRSGKRLVVSVEPWMTLAKPQRSAIDEEARLLAATQGHPPDQVHVTIPDS